MEQKHNPEIWRLPKDGELERHPDDQPDLVIGGMEFRFLPIGGLPSIPTKAIKDFASRAVTAVNSYDSDQETIRGLTEALDGEREALATWLGGLDSGGEQSRAFADEIEGMRISYDKIERALAKARAKKGA